MTGRRVFRGAAIVTIASVIVVAQHAPAPSGEWISYGGDAGNAKHSSLSDIDASNARDLRIAWRWMTIDDD